jgi:hypothetical protein
VRCERHPNVETNLLCGRCETAICPRCMVMTPVGARCPKCAQVRRLPTFQVGANMVLRAIGVGIVFAVGVGALWGFVNSFNFLRGFFDLIIMMVIGYFAGEVISNATNRKRGVSLQIVAGVTVFLTWAFSVVTPRALAEMRAGEFLGALVTFVLTPVVSPILAFGLLVSLNLFSIIGLVVAIAIAVYRLK